MIETLSHVARFIEARALGGLLLVTVAAWCGFTLVDAVTTGGTHSFDEAILLALRTTDPSQPVGGITVEEIARDVTSLGGVVLVAAISIGAAVLLVLVGRARSAVFLLVAVVGGSLISEFLKGLFDRPRPELVSQEVEATSASFPSGHSMLAAVVYLTLATLLARVTPIRRLKTFYFVVAGLIVFAVGVSRVYLGVHWPTDVIAGWVLGAAWALAVWLLGLWRQQGGSLDMEEDEKVGPLISAGDRPAVTRS